MNLNDYVKSERGRASSLAKKLDISMAHLSQILGKTRGITPLRAVAIEQATNGAVTRKDLRPDDWHKIWPELNPSTKKSKKQ